MYITTLPVSKAFKAYIEATTPEMDRQWGGYGGAEHEMSCFLADVHGKEGPHQIEVYPHSGIYDVRDLLFVNFMRLHLSKWMIDYLLVGSALWKYIYHNGFVDITYDVQAGLEYLRGCQRSDLIPAYIAQVNIWEADL